MDQVLVQRVFAAKSLNEGRLGATFCGFLKLTTPFILVMLGIIALALYHQGKLAMPLDAQGKAINDAAYPTMLGNLMPHGLLGLTVAGIAAALMGHISATYNSISTLVTRDIFMKFRPDADSATQIRVGRLLDTGQKVGLAVIPSSGLVFSREIFHWHNVRPQ
jgi:SSS family solute:Na+ symporter